MKTRTSRCGESKSFWGNPWLRGGVIALAGLGGALLLPAGLAWVFTHPPRRLHRRTPTSALGIPFVRVVLRADDGTRLSAWFVPAAPRPLGQPKGVVVVCHGYYGNRASMLPYLSFLHAAGYATLLFDFRAHGWSGGRMATFGVRETLDLSAALDWIDTRHELQGVSVAVLGESMGASVALLTAANDPRIKAVVADSAFARFDSAVEGRLHLAFGPRLTPLLLPGTRRAGERLLQTRSADIAPVEAMARIAPRPVLLVHGKRDRLIAGENAHRLLEAAPQGATLWEVANAGHVGAVLAAGPEYARRVTAFLDRALGDHGRGSAA